MARAGLEKIVRPFQLRDTSPPQRVFDQYQKDTKDVVLTAGKGGSGKTFNGSYTVTATLYMDTKLKEPLGPS